MRKVCIACALACIVALPAAAQVNYRPTAPPTVMADDEPWFVGGEPVTFNGTVYYPAGPQVHFNGNEMVPSGTFRAIPIYTRTTIEPYSVVFVPVSGGLMQPYERRRDGDLAGTVGSAAPSFPVSRSSEAAEAARVPQAPSAPTMVSVFGAPRRAAAPSPAVVPQPAATTGTVPAPPPAAPPSQARPRGDGLFVDFDGQRWFSAGKAIPFDAARMVRVGEHGGFTVYSDKSGRRDTIYVPVSRDAGRFVAPYSRRAPR